MSRPLRHRTRQHVERARRDLDALFLPIRKDERMRTPPIRRCAFAGCTTFAAGKYCHKHRRPIGNQHVSTAELIARAQEDLHDHDELMDETPEDKA